MITMFSKETYIHDAELEIVVPNGTLDFNEENIDDIIDAQQRNQIFYGKNFNYLRKKKYIFMKE
jgi:hypothetical protein